MPRIHSQPADGALAVLDAALGGVFQLEGEAARRAKRRAMRIAMALSVPAVGVILALICVTALFSR